MIEVFCADIELFIDRNLHHGDKRDVSIVALPFKLCVISTNSALPNNSDVKDTF
jgi:hypothetical protein